MWVATIVDGKPTFLTEIVIGIRILKFVLGAYDLTKLIDRMIDELMPYSWYVEFSRKYLHDIGFGNYLIIHFLLAANIVK